VSKEIYPSGYIITNQYDKYGYLTRIADRNGLSIWNALESNAKGQLTKSSQGGRETVFGFNDPRGFLTSIVTTGISEWSYKFNDKGNLEYRQDNLTGYKESFGYDPMNRLNSWDIYQGATSTPVRRSVQKMNVLGSA